MRLPQVSSNTAVVTGPIATGSWVKRTPSARSRSNSARTSSTPKDVNGAVRLLWRDDGQPAGSTHRDICLLLEPEYIGIEPERLVLIVNQHTRDRDPHVGFLSLVMCHRSVISRNGAMSRSWNL